MGIIWGMSIVVTFFVLFFQLSVFAGGLILVSFIASRFLKPSKRKSFFSKTRLIVVCIASIMFIFMYATYYNYISSECFGRATPDNTINRYWKKNLGRGSIGTVSFMNPILSPLLYLLPKDSDRDKYMDKKLSGQSNSGSQQPQKNKNR